MQKCVLICMRVLTPPLPWLLCPRSVPARDPSIPVALSGPGVPVSLKLIEKETLSSDTRRFRFALPSPDMALGLPVGNHMTLSFTDASGAVVTRPYTPVTSDEVRGYCDLVVKVYFGGVNPRFPASGAMTQHLEALAIGDAITAEGPSGRIVYAGRGALSVKDYAAGTTAVRNATHIGMIAGGSGITPMLALIRAVFSDPADTTRVSLVYANQTPADVLLRAELDAIAAAHPNFKVYYTVDRVPEGSAPWSFGTGFVSADMFAAHLPPPGAATQVLLCGPPGMINNAVMPAFEKLGYTADMHLSF
jgi:cytochrome-b5 reductase